MSCVLRECIYASLSVYCVRYSSYDVVTLRYIYGHVTYTGMLHIWATLCNSNDTTTNGVSNYTKSYTVDMLKNPS